MAVTDIIKALQKHDVEVGGHAIDKFVEKLKEVLTNEDVDLLESLESHLTSVTEKVKEELKEETKQMMKNPNGKKQKDPNAPKRPPTAYNLFVKEKLEELSKSHPDTNRQELMKMAVNVWRKEHPKTADDAKKGGKKDKTPAKALLSDTEPEEVDSDAEKASPSHPDAKKGSKKGKKGGK